MVLKHFRRTTQFCRHVVLFAILGVPAFVQAQRVALKTNALYWAAFTPNIGAEFRVNRHVTFNFEAAYNRIDCFHLDSRGALITPEVRYWFSARPQTGHFVGLAGIGCDYHYVYDDGKRHKGDLYGGGVTYGYSFVLSRRWSLETTLGVGVAHVQEMNWEKDEPEPGVANLKEWKVIPLKAGVTFVYLLK